MDENATTKLTRALADQFSESEAPAMARLLVAALANENIYYEDLPLDDAGKNDYLLMAYEERLLIPIRSQQTAAWDDRTMRFGPGEMFFMTRLVRTLLENAAKTGVFDSEAAIRHILAHETEGHIADSVRFLKQIRPHTDTCMAEGGLMAAVAQKAGLQVAVHDIIDACVIVGIMSPCSRGSSIQGLVWYEINPCLYWDQKFV
ncbi:MAG: hypothetical protein ACQERN_09670 [Thermodesulfobacteriota bacterium]